jgi:hypothetical protein
MWSVWFNYEGEKYAALHWSRSGETQKARDLLGEIEQPLLYELATDTKRRL